MTFAYLCNGWKVCSNGNTSVPKSVPRLLFDKVRLGPAVVAWFVKPSVYVQLKFPISIGFSVVSNEKMELCLYMPINNNHA